MDKLALTPAQRSLAAQILRYGLTGGFVTLLGVSTYAGSVRLLGTAPLVANMMAYLIAVGVGYFLHSRFSFRGQTNGGASVTQGAKFFMTSGVSFTLNSIFVWLFTHILHWNNLSPILAMLFITPAICFVIYRYWVFQ